LRPWLTAQSFDSVWSSDLRRAVVTARLAFGEPQRDPRLRELHFGILEGLPWQRLPAPHQEALDRFADLAPPGGETTEELRRRVAAFLDRLPSGRHLVFTHGGVIRAVRQLVGDDGFVSTGTVVAVEWRHRVPVFVRHREL
jgi:probable phosphoglycerate mutase